MPTQQSKPLTKSSHELRPIISPLGTCSVHSNTRPISPQVPTTAPLAAAKLAAFRDVPPAQQSLRPAVLHGSWRRVGSGAAEFPELCLWSRAVLFPWSC